MVTCPRCEHPVDETAVSVCPLCNTPLQAVPEPASAPAQPVTASSAMPTPVSLRGASTAASAVPPPTVGIDAMAPGMIRSLTGEIIETPATTATPATGPGSYSSGQALPRPAAARPAVPRPAGATPRPFESAPVSSGSKAGPIIAVVLALVVALGGGWFWWSHRPGATPTDTVQRVLTAFSTDDYKSMYNLVDLPADQKAKYPDAQAFEDAIKTQMKTVDSSPLSGMVKSLKDTMKKAKIGEAKIDGDTATVPITMHVSLFGVDKDVSQNVSLKHTDGIWKISGNGVGAGLAGGGLGL